MIGNAFQTRDTRQISPAVTPLPSKKRVAAVLRRAWRSYCDRQAHRAIAVMLHAMDDRALENIGIDRRAFARG